MGSTRAVLVVGLGISLALLSGVGLAGGSPPATAALDADGVVERLQARYDATSSFKAAFEQEIASRAFAQKLTSRGTVYFHRPGRMRWEFAGSGQQTVIADGQTLWIYQEAQRQVLKIGLERAFRTRTPVSFLIGLGNLSEDFTGQLKPLGPNGEVVLRLRPRESDADVGTLELWLAPQTYDILGALVTDATGGTTRWRFSDLERNVALRDELFTFKVPKGVDVIVPPS